MAGAAMQRYQPTHQRELLIHTPVAQPVGAIRGRYLAQEHTDMWTGGARNQTADLLASGRPTLPPDPSRPPTASSQNFYVVFKPLLYESCFRVVLLCKDYYKVFVLSII